MSAPSIFSRLRAWLDRRSWTTEQQLEHLRIMVQEDNRWLANSRVANELTNRYLKALDPNWYKLHYESSNQFRRRLGLEPHSERKDLKT